MPRMLPEIHTLEQHKKQLQDNPDAYRPKRCPHCGRAGLHHHGHYQRNTPKGEGMAGLWPICILRFFCPACKHTCSCLPGCLSPRRHYWWKTQQEMFMPLLAGKLSMYALAKQATSSRRIKPSYLTINRWWQALEARSNEFIVHLRSRFPELGRASDWKEFWLRCFESMSLADAMGWLDRSEVSVP